ncbi:MAG: endonuclease/exonuclease/phosphatase family protein [Polyangiaceae bacterium]
MTLRIATLNIWNKAGPWPERCALIRKQLGELRPDVIGLQEVLRLTVDGKPKLDPESDQATELAEGLGYEIAYAPAMHYGGGLLFGNALLSRHPIREQASIELPGREPGEARALLYALVETPFGLLPVFVTHLNWKLHHGSIRLLQTRFIAEKIFELCPVDESRLPPVLMGDLNAGPEADEIRYLSGHATVEAKSVYFADAWVYAGEGPGYTFDRKNRFAALAHEPPRRIDYIFVRGPDRLLRGEPLSTRLAFHQASGPREALVWPSDHFGVVSDIAATPRSE